MCKGSEVCVCSFYAHAVMFYAHAVSAATTARVAMAANCRYAVSAAQFDKLCKGCNDCGGCEICVFTAFAANFRTATPEKCVSHVSAIAHTAFATCCTVLRITAC